jgi:hypothetical protein
MAELELAKLDGKEVVQYAPHVVCSLSSDKVALITQSGVKQTLVMQKIEVRAYDEIIPINAFEFFVVSRDKCRRFNLRTKKSHSGNCQPWWWSKGKRPSMVALNGTVFTASGWTITVGDADSSSFRAQYNVRQGFEKIRSLFEDEQEYKARVASHLSRFAGKRATRNLLAPLEKSVNLVDESWEINLISGNCHTSHGVLVYIVAATSLAYPKGWDRVYKLDLSTNEFFQTPFTISSRGIHHSCWFIQYSLGHIIRYDDTGYNFDASPSVPPPFLPQLNPTTFVLQQCYDRIFNSDCIITLYYNVINFGYHLEAKCYVDVPERVDHVSKLCIMPVSKEEILAMAKLLAERAGVVLPLVVWGIVADILAH